MNRDSVATTTRRDLEDATLLRAYPKTRTPLPTAIQEIYIDQYKQNREGGSIASALAQRAESWLHRKVAADLQERIAPRTLEIGAGTLNQLRYEDKSSAYDIVEPFRQLFEDSRQLSRIRQIFSDIAEVPLSNRYNRITSVATFEHICDLPAVIARTGLLLESHGMLRVAIPSEGSPLWTLGWRLTTGLEFRLRHGLDYAALIRHEHVNTAHEIEALLSYFYDVVESAYFGFGRRLSLYQFHACHAPRIDRCREYLDLTD